MACIRKRRGKRVVDFRDGAGVRRWKTCETKRKAEDYLANVLPETRQWAGPAVDPNITVRAYATRWFEQVKATVKHRTYVRYEELVRLHICPPLRR